MEKCTPFTMVQFRCAKFPIIHFTLSSIAALHAVTARGFGFSSFRLTWAMISIQIKLHFKHKSSFQWAGRLHEKKKAKHQMDNWLHSNIMYVSVVGVFSPSLFLLKLSRWIASTTRSINICTGIWIFFFFLSFVRWYGSNFVEKYSYVSMSGKYVCVCVCVAKCSSVQRICTFQRALYY